MSTQRNTTKPVDYVLVTPARNEEGLIGGTIASVLAQTVRPRKWVIVSDGSTDRTDEIVADAAEQNPFISLIRVSAREKRSFSSKVNAFRVSHELLDGVAFDYLGALDADVTFAPNYFEHLLGRLERDEKLGIAGGVIQELIDGRYVEQRTSLNSVAGAVQMFRRSCYEGIGGYIPLRYGGIDSAAEIMARMHGWQVQTFPDLKVLHHRRVSSGTGGMIRTKLRHGIGHYSLGYHPVFQLVRCAYRVLDRPYVVGSLLMACGYFWAWTTRMEKAAPKDLIEYLRTEQADRLRAMFRISGTRGASRGAGAHGPDGAQVSAASAGSPRR
jgi:glycosyltransferase involved in cell wall biosynthesis